MKQQQKTEQEMKEQLREANRALNKAIIQKYLIIAGQIALVAIPSFIAGVLSERRTRE